MKFAFYCRSLRFSGGRSVALGLLNELKIGHYDHEFVVYAPMDPLYHDLQSKNMNIHCRNSHGGVHQMLAQNLLRMELDRDKPDALFMMGNLGYRQSPCPQAVLVHNPWILYPETPAWKMLSLRDRIYYKIRRYLQASSFKYCDAILAQTPVMIERLHNLLHIPYAKMALMLNSFTATRGSYNRISESSRKITSRSHTHRSLCLSRYFTHKNLFIFLKVADELLLSGRDDILLITTVDAYQHSEAARFIKEAMKNGRDRVLLNIGEVPMQDVPSCYDSANSMILPSLLECFTGNYPDAMQAGVPIITSDLDFAHVVCSNAALYVDPMDAHGIANTLCSLADNPDLNSSITSAGQNRSRFLSVGWDEISKDIVVVMEKLALKQSLPNVTEHRWMKEWTKNKRSCDFQ